MALELQLTEKTTGFLESYGDIPIAFEVRQRLRSESLTPGSASLSQLVAVDPPYVKDYDALPGQRPSQWASRWDLSCWRFAAAMMDGRLVGCAAIALDPKEIEDNADRADEAIIWDIRVGPVVRRQGVGRQLLAFVEGIARAAGKRLLRVETQDINVPACRLYHAAGFQLAGIEAGAYPELPDETRLTWAKSVESE